MTIGFLDMKHVFFSFAFPVHLNKKDQRRLNDNSDCATIIEWNSLWLYNREGCTVNGQETQEMSSCLSPRFCVPRERTMR